MARRAAPAGTSPLPPALAPQVRAYRFTALLKGARYAEGVERQAEAAALLGISKSHYWELETGRVKPTEAERTALLRALPILGRLLSHARELNGSPVEVAGRL